MMIKQYLLFLMVASAVALGSAFVAEYGFGLKPCPLCIYQRIPYAVVIGLGVIALLRRSLAKPLLWLAVLVLFIDAGIAFYHVGVEQHWFEGLQTCAGEGFSGDADAILAQMLNTEAVRCDVPAFVFLGLSMAGWNMLYAFALGVIGLNGLLRKVR